jgi:ADP-dependent NAD(P)H-hydrate dehydratase
MTDSAIDVRYLRSHPLQTHQATDKHGRGRVLVVGGNVDLPGATVLAGLGVLRAGAGVLRIATCQINAPHVAAAMPEAMVVGLKENSDGEIAAENIRRLIDLASTSDVVLIGPGMVHEASVGQLCSTLMSHVDGPHFVLDAAAFTVLRCIDLPNNKRGRMVGTPHAGEMAKYLQRDRDDVEENPLAAAREASSRLGAVIAMKGASTFVVAPGGESLLNEHGSIGLATSGSGDTLAGILAGLLARGTAPFVATAWAVYLHAEAGQRIADRIGRLGLLARELPEEIPRIMKELE